MNDKVVLGWTRDKRGAVVDRHPVQVANAVTSGKRDNTQNYVAEYIAIHTDASGREYMIGIVEYNGALVRIRKLTERECFRLMGVSESDIDKIQASGVSRSRQYCLAGNSIVVDVLEKIFDKLFIHTEKTSRQLTLF